VDWATQRPEDVAFHLYDMAGQCVELTAGELRRRAGGVAAGLAGCGLGAGDRVAVSLDTGPDLIVTLFGAALLGAVPVLLEPPLAEGRARVWGQRVGQVLRCVRPGVLVAGQAASHHLQSVAEVAGVRLMLPSTVVGAAGLALPPADRDAAAVLQMTSGTLGVAKAVCLTHRALFANAAAIAATARYRTDDLMVSWLPLHHDMGLTGAVISTFLHRIPVVLLPPMAFLLRPERWLWAVHRFRGTLSPAPNFAYHLCVRKVRDEALDGLDLGSWRMMFNGAEIVNAATVHLWQERFGRYGVRPESMRPAYGMAEMGVAVAMTGPDEAPRVDYVDREVLAGTDRAVPVRPDGAHCCAVVAVGRPLPGYQVRVVDATGSSTVDRVQGRILVRGPSLMTGYFDDPAATAAAIHDGWLDTGDIGYLADGELFITGRAADLLIVAGRNYHPYAAEAAATALPGVRTGGAAVVGVPDPAQGTDAVAVVVESAAALRASQRDALAEAVSRVVADELGVRPERVLVVRPGTLPRTPSGKLRRAQIAADLTIEGRRSHDGVDL
jgi:acyl-CoA synthetase (AMP-forming)/AMP-acid ligase II